MCFTSTWNQFLWNVNRHDLYAWQPLTVLLNKGKTSLSTDSYNDNLTNTWMNLPYEIVASKSNGNKYT